MMCGVIMSVFAVMLIGACYLYGAIAIGAIILLLCLLVSIGNYINVKKLRPTPMICPNCHSTNIRIGKEVSGISNIGVGSYHAGWGVRSGNVNINRQRLGICQDCGFDYPYYTEQEVKQIQQQALNSMAIWIGLTAIAIVAYVMLRYKPF